MGNKIINKILITLIISALLWSVVKWLICFTIISGHSMEPTYHEGDFVTANRFVKLSDICYNDIILLKQSENIFSSKLIKRVVALPGDTVRITDGKLYVNGVAMGNNDYPAMESAGIAGEEITLAEDEVFVLGDNRNNSADSRVLGPIKKSQIIGRVNVE